MEFAADSEEKDDNVPQRTYTVSALNRARRNASGHHREMMESDETSVEDLAAYLNGLASGSTPFQHIADTMKAEGNYPWSDNEVANFALNEKIGKPVENQVEYFNGHYYAWNVIQWEPIVDYDESENTFYRIKFTYNASDLLECREELDRLWDRYVKEDEANDLYEIAIEPMERRLRKIERAMKREGTYPWTEEERANVGLSYLPPNAWNAIHVFNGLQYIREKGSWVRYSGKAMDEPTTDDIPF